MQTIRVLEKTGKDGTLHLDIPLGKPEAEFDVVVHVQPTGTAAIAGTPEDPGWPDHFFETIRIADAAFARPPQGTTPPAPSFC